jgi:rod shape-determining protein MreC
MLTGLIFLFTPQKLTNNFQLAFARIFSWPLSIGRNISLSARMQQPSTDVVSRREYNKLQNHLTNVMEELLQKQRKIKKLSGLYDKLYALEGARLMVADVITAFIDGSQRELIINRGKIDGLAEGQFVLGDNSIVGTISNVSSHTARVKLINDPTSKIAVKIAELNVERLMQGNGNNSAKVQLLSIKHKVKTGDIVYARKKPGFLDAPMIIGTVAQCKRDDENPSLWDITVKPACDIETLNDVAVIVMNPKE